jgi:SAM-dependent methyltransferase
MPCAYDDFAWFYDRYWNEEFHGVAFPILDRIWLPRLPASARILDVCCGTGFLARLLSDRGYPITGIDLSSEMIAHARSYAPAAEFHVADVCDFVLPHRYDAAVSTFDSLNHILGYDRFEAALRQTAAALKSGASLCFDVLFEEAYRTRFGEGFAIVREDHVLTITGSRFDPRSRVAQCRITMFRRLDGQWRRADAVVKEQCYSPEEIDRALDAAGFGEVACYDARDLGMGDQLGAGRTFYVATKRASKPAVRGSGRARPSSGR